jgi:hypothetical protein
MPDVALKKKTRDNQCFFLKVICQIAASLWASGKRQGKLITQLDLNIASATWVWCFIFLCAVCV